MQIAAKSNLSFHTISSALARVPAFSSSSPTATKPGMSTSSTTANSANPFRTRVLDRLRCPITRYHE